MACVTRSTYKSSSGRLGERERDATRGRRDDWREVSNFFSSAFFQFSQGIGGVSGLVGSGRSRVVSIAAWSEEYECSKETSVTHDVARPYASSLVQTRSMVVFD